MIDNFVVKQGNLSFSDIDFYTVNRNVCFCCYLYSGHILENGLSFRCRE